MRNIDSVRERIASYEANKLKEQQMKSPWMHANHGCEMAAPSPDGIRRHRFTTVERKTEAGCIKLVLCTLCSKDPGQL